MVNMHKIAYDKSLTLDERQEALRRIAQDKSGDFEDDQPPNDG